MLSERDIRGNWFFDSKKPIWKMEFESKMYQLETRTGLSRKELLKVAEAIDFLNIIRL